MQQKDFVQILAQQNNLSNVDATLITKMVFGTLNKLISSGETINFNGFGKFHIKTVPAREGRNPKNGEKLQIQEHKKMVFKPSVKLKERVRNL